MQDGQIREVSELLEVLSGAGQKFRTNGVGRALFRGQNCNNELLPSVARKPSAKDTTGLEEEMLNELKRRGGLIVNESLTTDWEWLAFAQHNHMATRLLDWTSNPLIALWFAIQDKSCLSGVSYLYSFYVARSHILSNAELESGPFKVQQVKVVRPKLVNKRIVAQHGWFTCHPYDNTVERYLSVNDLLGADTVETFSYVIRPEYKLSLLDELEMLGINAQTVYPDTYGLALQINWDYRKILYEGF